MAKEFEVLGGGATFGGKTFALVIDPLRFIDYNDFKFVFYRRTYEELMESVWPLAMKFYGAAGARWNEQKKQFTFPSGAVGKLRYLEHQEDWRRYQGGNNARQYFDELTNIHPENYVKLNAWCRSAVPGILPQRKSTTNPSGIGHSFVKKKFIETCKPTPCGEKRFDEFTRTWWQPVTPGPTHWQKMEKPDGSFGWTSCRYIPFRVFDNPDGLRNNPEYVMQILQYPERLRRAFLMGDWDAFEGQFFKFNTEAQLIEPHVVPLKEYEIIGSLDPGWGGFCSYSLSYVDYEQNYYRIATYYASGKNMIKNVKDILKFTQDLPLTKGKMPEYVVADPAAWAKRDQYALVESEKTFADIMEQAGFIMEKGLNDRLTGWANMCNYMEKTDENKNNKYFVFKHYNEPFVEQVLSAQGDDKKPGDLQGQGRDASLHYHCLDEERYRLMALAHPEKPVREKIPPELQKELEEVFPGEDSYSSMGV